MNYPGLNVRLSDQVGMIYAAIGALGSHMGAFYTTVLQF